MSARLEQGEAWAGARKETGTGVLSDSSESEGECDARIRPECRDVPRLRKTRCQCAGRCQDCSARGARTCKTEHLNIYGHGIEAVSIC